jgi:phenylpropionate dioxygenase-like ring-hydroxylating dioxygenase large terminal subunit
MAFLRSIWYVAAWKDEITDRLFSRTFLNEPVLMYRKQNGEAVAIGDRCPHRFAPLHMGRLVGDAVECPYHGLQFDCSGACIKNPHGDGKIPQAAKVKSYPLVEKYDLLWIWMGQPERADPSRIPAFEQIVDPQKRTIKGYTAIQANYELVADNLLDLSHAQFVHADFLRTDAFLEAAHEVVQEGQTVHSRRWVPNTKGPASYMRHFDDPEMLVDHWMRARWDAPGLCRLDVGVTPAGRPESEGIRRQGSHLLTPETETSTHYFYASTRNFRINDPATDDQVREWHRVGFGEQDKPMIEAVQRMMGTTDLMSLRPVLLSVDSAAMRGRRILARLIEQEASELKSDAA